MKSIVPLLTKGNIVVIESTMAPRSTEDIIKPLIEQSGFNIGKDIYLVHSPERVLPGNILHEMIHNNRIIGGVTKECTKKGVEIYSTFIKGEILQADSKTAELAKLLENTFRDVNIALANEMAKFGNDLRINIIEAFELANKHPRVNIHSPGPGVGGHCLAVDPYFLTSTSPQNSKIIQLSREINNSMPEFIIENVEKISKKYNIHKITILGLSYKGNVDDIRESPALEIYNILKNNYKYNISVYDPYVQNNLIERDFKKAILNSDLLLILSDHSEFKIFDLEDLNLMKNIIIFDTKNIVENVPQDAKIINFGNLYEYTKK